MRELLPTREDLKQFIFKLHFSCSFEHRVTDSLYRRDLDYPVWLFLGEDLKSYHVKIKGLFYEHDLSGSSLIENRFKWECIVYLGDKKFREMSIHSLMLIEELQLMGEIRLHNLYLEKILYSLSDLLTVDHQFKNIRPKIGNYSTNLDDSVLSAMIKTSEDLIKSLMLNKFNTKKLIINSFSTSLVGDFSVKWESNLGEVVGYVHYIVIGSLGEIEVHLYLPNSIIELDSIRKTIIISTHQLKKEERAHLVFNLAEVLNSYYVSEIDEIIIKDLKPTKVKLINII